MKRTLIAAVFALSASTAFAGPSTDVLQIVTDVQEALNRIDILSSGTNIAQDAVNAANLISVEGAQIDDVAQIGFLTTQVAKNVAISEWSSFTNLDQAATNVLNSVDAGKIDNILQGALGDQYASNYVQFDDLDLAPFDLDNDMSHVKQAATNVANTISATTLEGFTIQLAAVDQDAINSAVGAGTAGLWPADVSNLTQEAVNAANLVSVGTLPSNFSVLPDIVQVGIADQVASNTLAASVKVNTAVQSATNVVNSISLD